MIYVIFGIGICVGLLVSAAIFSVGAYLGYKDCEAKLDNEGLKPIPNEHKVKKIGFN